MRVKYSALHQMHLAESNGKDVTCKCGRVLTWQKASSVNDYWRAVCPCGQVYLETAETK